MKQLFQLVSAISYEDEDENEDEDEVSIDWMVSYLNNKPSEHDIFTFR